MINKQYIIIAILFSLVPTMISFALFMEYQQQQQVGNNLHRVLENIMSQEKYSIVTDGKSYIITAFPDGVSEHIEGLNGNNSVFNYTEAFDYQERLFACKIALNNTEFKTSVVCWK